VPPSRYLDEVGITTRWAEYGHELDSRAHAQVTAPQVQPADRPRKPRAVRPTAVARGIPSLPAISVPCPTGQRAIHGSANCATLAMLRKSRTAGARGKSVSVTVVTGMRRPRAANRAGDVRGGVLRVCRRTP